MLNLPCLGIGITLLLKGKGRSTASRMWKLKRRLMWSGTEIKTLFCHCGILLPATILFTVLYGVYLCFLSSKELTAVSMCIFPSCCPHSLIPSNSLISTSCKETVFFLECSSSLPFNHFNLNAFRYILYEVYSCPSLTLNFCLANKFWFSFYYCYYF